MTAALAGEAGMLFEESDLLSAFIGCCVLAWTVSRGGIDSMEDEDSVGWCSSDWYVGLCTGVWVCGLEEWLGWFV
jgi:hypothetical protein